MVAQGSFCRGKEGLSACQRTVARFQFDPFYSQRSSDQSRSYYVDADDDDGEMICFIAPRRGYIQISSLMPDKFKLIKVSLVEEEEWQWEEERQVQEALIHPQREDEEDVAN